MNRTQYRALRRSIRDNGIRYTTRHAADSNNAAALGLCNAINDTTAATDWLAERVNFARREKPAVAFKLTSSAWLKKREMDYPIIWSK